MTDAVCPFCGRDPFHYVHNGLGYEPVAVNCCDSGIELYARQENRLQRLYFSGDPRKMRRALSIGKRMNGL